MGLRNHRELKPGEGERERRGRRGKTGKGGKRGISEGTTLGYAVEYSLPREGASPLQGAMGRQLD